METCCVVLPPVWRLVTTLLFAVTFGVGSPWTQSGSVMNQAAGSQSRLVSISELSMRANAVRSVLPIYPADCVQQGVSGVAVAEVLVDDRGQVESVKVLSAPCESMREAVRVAAMAWRFAPTELLDSRSSRRVPTRVDTKLTFYFEIRGSRPGVSGPAASGPSSSRKRGVIEGRPEDLASLEKNGGLQIVDIRARDLFSRGHRAGAVNIPADEVESRAQELTAARVIAIECYPEMTLQCRLVAGALISRGVTRADIWLLLGR